MAYESRIWCRGFKKLILEIRPDGIFENGVPLYKGIITRYGDGEYSGLEPNFIRNINFKEIAAMWKRELDKKYNKKRCKK